MKMASTIVAVVILAGAASPAGADILVWRDSAGVSHYTNDLVNVPPEYRQNAITVAKDWERAEPPPEPVPAAVAPVAVAPVAVPAAPDDQRSLYEAGYVAGMRAAGEGPQAAVASSSVAPVIQNFQVGQPEPVREHLIPFVGPVVVERRQPTPSKEDELRRRFPPAQPAPFLQGPAGPPPVSMSR